MKELKKEIHRSVLFKFKEKDLLLDKKKIFRTSTLKLLGIQLLTFPIHLI